MHDALRKAREMLETVTPLKTDCGRVCGARCCRSLEGEETGMLLFPGEEACYAGKPGWKLRKTPSGTLLVCPGDCARDERPLACRIFPLLPVIRDGEVKVAADQRARDPAFAETVREAGKILTEDAAQRTFIERMTEEQDELKSLRDRLGGI